jgi:hypothetical protein
LVAIVDWSRWRKIMGGRPPELRRSSVSLRLILQRTIAATIAWLLANQIVHHHDPFFAPLSAVVALNAPLGERGRNTLRLLFGVVIGIAVGELAVAVVGGGYGTLAVATFTAMVLAHVLGGARIMVTQAAAGAILTVASADGNVGVNRLIDALIGGGVALVFSQALFAPEPVWLLRRAEAVALAAMARGLRETARALDEDDESLAQQAVDTLRELRDQLVELARLRRAGRRIVRNSLVWRWRATPVVQETENAGHLDLLGGSCLVLARTTMDISKSDRRTLAPLVRDLADVLTDLEDELGNRPARQRAAERALDVARRIGDADVMADSALGAVLVALRMVSTDLMVFAGVDPEQAATAVTEGANELDVRTPPRTLRLPFNRDRWPPRR